MYIQPLIEGEYFHIYNRGVNGEDIFKEDKNYSFFLEKYNSYCSDVLETFSYCLLKNHFHILAYVKPDVEVARTKGTGMIRLNASKQLSHFFNSYAQAMNKVYGRTGPLFESPFERKLIDDDSYFTSMVFYCHYNAQKHGFVKDFKDWKYSSYHQILQNDNRLLSSQKVLNWFGGVDLFKKIHDERYSKDKFEKFNIE